MNIPAVHFPLTMTGLFRFAVVAALCAVLSVCASTPELPEGRIKVRFEAYDKNGDDMITWKEFRSSNHKMPKRKARQYFNRYDLDRDGIIKKEEVIQIHGSE